MIEYEEVDILDKKPPMVFIELVDQGNSGFIQDDTIGTLTPIQLRAPSIRFIPNVGYRRGTKTEIRNGKEMTVRYNEAIRYIKNEEIIVLSEQKRLGIEPSPLAREDKIAIEKGFAAIVREGSSVGLFDFIVEAYYNDSNPERSERATALYRVVDLNKRVEQINEDELIAADAVKFVGSLYEKVGKNIYRYNEDKIDACCEMLAIVAQTPATRIQALMSIAKQRPEWFMQKVTSLEHVTITEVTHALELGVIRFNNNVAEYVSKEKILKSLGGGKLSHDTKITKLADWLGTAEAHGAYIELKAEIDIAKNNALNSQ